LSGLSGISGKYKKAVVRYIKRAPADFNLWGERRARRRAIQVHSTQSHKP